MSTHGLLNRRESGKFNSSFQMMRTRLVRTNMCFVYYHLFSFLSSRINSRILENVLTDQPEKEIGIQDA